MKKAWHQAFKKLLRTADVKEDRVETISLKK
jgi:hypothetical protein